MICVITGAKYDDKKVQGICLRFLLHSVAATTSCCSHQTPARSQWEFHLCLRITLHASQSCCFIAVCDIADASAPTCTSSRSPYSSPWLLARETISLCTLLLLRRCDMILRSEARGLASLHAQRFKMALVESSAQESGGAGSILHSASG